MQQTIGQYRIGKSNNEEINAIKHLTANTIDSVYADLRNVVIGALINLEQMCVTKHDSTINPEVQRCYQIAIAHIIEANKQWSYENKEACVDNIEGADVWIVKAMIRPELPEHLKSIN